MSEQLITSITVLGYEDAIRVARDFDAIISIYDDPKYSVSPPSIDTMYLSLQMWDVTPLKFYGQPHKLDIACQLKQAKRFIESIPEGEKVLIHCNWGKSRSAAVAVMALMLQGLNVNGAIDVVREARPQAEPNWYYLAVIQELLKDA